MVLSRLQLYILIVDTPMCLKPKQETNEGQCSVQLLCLVILLSNVLKDMLRKNGQNSVMKEATGNLLYIINNVCVV